MRERLVSRFREIVVDRLDRLHRALAEVNRRPGDGEAATVLKREVHTVKGEARMAGFRTTSRIAHEIEDLLQGVGVTALDRGRSARISEGFDLLSVLASMEPDTSETHPVVLAWRHDGSLSAAHGGLGKNENSAMATETSQTGEVISGPDRDVSDRDLDGLSHEASELVELVARQSLLVDDLREQGRTRPRGPAERAAWDALEDATALLTKGARRIEDRLHRLRFLPLETLLERFPVAVRDLADEQGKLVQVEISSGAVEIDARILDRVGEPLLHLVRNAVDHGVEFPEDRGRTEKALRATITLTATRVDEDVEIVITDDGAGIDVAEVRAALVWRGDLTPEQAMAMSPAAVLDCIFAPEFSTRTDVTMLSGRGVGLAIVRDTLEQLGGTVRVETSYGKWTTFTLRFPTAIARENVLLVRAGTFFAAIRSESVVSDVPDASVLRYGLAEIIALRGAGGLYGADEVHLRHKGKSIALVVDAIVGTRAVLQRPLDPLIRGVRLYQGSIEFAHGQIAMVLSVPELFRLARRSAGVQTPLPARRRARVLVVDDSQFTRELVVDVFERMGFEVAEAEEGRRGVDCFHDAGAELIVTDLDMPVLDGFGLIEAVRAIDTRVPIAVFTTRATPEARDRALQLGANVFLVKTEFRERQLHDLVARFVSRD